jgi:hypothetical protein
MWAPYVVGQGGHRRSLEFGGQRIWLALADIWGPECRKNEKKTAPARGISQQMAQYEPPAPPPYAWEVCWGAVYGYMTTVDSDPVGHFDRQKIAAQRLFPSPSS